MAKKKIGRPKGSKNKPKTVVTKKTKKVGRPNGSKNKMDLVQKELNYYRRTFANVRKGVKIGVSLLFATAVLHFYMKFIGLAVQNITFNNGVFAGMIAIVLWSGTFVVCKMFLDNVLKGCE